MTYVTILFKLQSKIEPDFFKMHETRPELIKKYSSNAHSRNTLRSYDKVYARLSVWLSQRELELNDRSLALYLTEIFEDGLSISICALTVSAVNHFAKKAGIATVVGEISEDVLKGIRRSNRASSGQVEGLTWTLADKVIKHEREKNTPQGIRNATLVAIGSDAMLRVSELQALVVEDLDIHVNATGSSTLHIPRSKTDQERNGHVSYLGPSTTTLLQDWLELSRISRGHVFRRLSRSGQVIGEKLSMGSIRIIIKYSIRDAGIDGHFSGHSLRVGSAISLAQHGATVLEMMQEGRWKSSKMPAHYVSGRKALHSATARLRYRNETFTE